VEGINELSDFLFLSINPLSKRAIDEFCEEIVQEGYQIALVSGVQVSNNCI